MTLKFIDLYNAAASQEWSMYDNDAASGADFEKSLVVALNKAICEILYSYPFSFREKTHILFTMPKRNAYEMPNGLIKRNKNEKYCIKLNSNLLKHIDNPCELEPKNGIPDSFYIVGNQLFLYPTPSEKLIVTINYTTLVIGEDKNGNEIFVMQNDDDIINIPAYLEEIFKDAVISRTMLNSIASESDENFSAYKKQSETAFKLLVKYSKGVEHKKSLNI